MFDRYKFTLLLAALLALLVVHPLLHSVSGFSWMYDLLLALVLFGGILILFQRRRSRVAAILLGIPSIGGIIVHGIKAEFSPTLATVAFHIVPVVFLTYIVVTILRSIFSGREILSDSINGAVCGYLLIGLAFGHLYCLAEALQPNSFDVNGQAPLAQASDEDRRSTLTYFSLVTVTTVGYGDITPRSQIARTFAWVEAALGQFYVAMIVAELVALKVATAVRSDRNAP